MQASAPFLHTYKHITHAKSLFPRFFSSINSHQTKSIALKDSHNRFHNYLRISLTEKCNLRCVYCMPEHGVSLTPSDKLLSLEERKKLISVFAHLGVTKLRFTGGEPTVSNQLRALIEHSRHQSISSIGITSNGIMLAEQLPKLVDAGLNSVNVSLDTLSAPKFASITRRDGKLINKVLSSIFLSMSKDIPVKVNCVVTRGINDMEIAEFVKFSQHYNVSIRFIELMPFDGNAWDSKQFVSYVEMLDRLKNEHSIVLTKDRGRSKDPHDTTKWYQVEGGEEGKQGSIGFITSMSSNFCGGCNRLRITADGKLKVCLFGNEEFNLLSTLRAGSTDEQLIEGIHQAVLQKKAVLGGHEDAIHIAKTSKENRPMILIGG